MGKKPQKKLLSLQYLVQVFEEQQNLPVPEALAIIHGAQEILDKEPNMVQLKTQSNTLHVYGDIHGQYYDLLNMMEQIDFTLLKENKMKLVFLGDYVDRGVFSCEVILYLLLLKIHYPKQVFLLRGNHECETISSFYGFRNECRMKYGISSYYHFINCFQTMPIAALLSTSKGKIFCVHGGISPNLLNLKDIDQIDRRREPTTDGPLCDLLWSDPQVEEEDEEKQEEEEEEKKEINKQEKLWSTNLVRGCSYYFKAQALYTFLEQNDLLCMIRAHEYEEKGFLYHFDRHQLSNQLFPPMMTVFSAPNYCDFHQNKGAYLILCDGFEYKWEIKQIESVPHPIPQLFGVERSSDMWKEFRKTCPFIPASKNFFEQVLDLASQERKGSFSLSDVLPPILTGRGGRRLSIGGPEHQQESFSSSSSMDIDTDETTNSNHHHLNTEHVRRMTSEMHPQALRRVLDEEAHKWIQSEEVILHTPPMTPLVSPTGVASFSLPDSSSSVSNTIEIEERSKLFNQQELEQLKLMFSLMDTDGSMTLSTKEIANFIQNVLGEKVLIQDAEMYLNALDYDGNGSVDLADLLSWAAVMKTNYDKNQTNAFVSLSCSSSFSTSTSTSSSSNTAKNLFKTSLWILLIGFLIHKTKKKSKSFFLLGTKTIAITKRTQVIGSGIVLVLIFIYGLKRLMKKLDSPSNSSKSSSPNSSSSSSPSSRNSPSSSNSRLWLFVKSFF